MSDASPTSSLEADRSPATSRFEPLEAPAAPAAPAARGRSSSGTLGSLATLKDVIDILAKLLPVLIGVIYAVGFIVTARRLASYGLATTQLISAQYFVAGIPPLALVMITAIALLSALRFDRSIHRRTFSAALLLTAMLFVILLVTELSGLEPRTLDTAAAFFFVTLRLVFAEAALWCVIAGLRSGIFREIGEFSARRGEGRSDQWLFPATLSVMGVAVLSVTFARIANVGEFIPQAYGGAKPIGVQLFVERAKLPAALRDTSEVAPEQGVVPTRQLELVFQNVNAFVVRLPGDLSRRVWTLDSQIVVSVVSIASR